MRILQISDLHLRGDGKLSFQVVDTRACFETTIAHLKAVFANPTQRPDLIVVTGDLADSGDTAAYTLVHNGLSQFGVPVYAVPGNHDRRDRMRELLKDWIVENAETAPSLCYAVQADGLRLLMLDTTKPSSHSGHCAARCAQWLDRELQSLPNTPTLIFMHHPPFVTGMGAMDEPYENIDLLREVITRAPWARLCCGHMHRPIFSMIGTVPCITAPAASMQIELDLSVKGGDEFRMEAPGYLLHDFNQGAINTHVCQIYGKTTYAGPYSFHPATKPLS